MSRNYSEITDEIIKLSQLCYKDNNINPDLYTEHKVYRGLRDLNGKGVLTGLTQISEIQSSQMVNGEKVSCEGKLYYRGYDVEELVKGFVNSGRFGFEEISYLLLFGKLPDKETLEIITQFVCA